MENKEKKIHEWKFKWAELKTAFKVTLHLNECTWTLHWTKMVNKKVTQRKRLTLWLSGGEFAMMMCMCSCLRMNECVCLCVNTFECKALPVSLNEWIHNWICLQISNIHSMELCSYIFSLSLIFGMCIDSDWNQIYLQIKIWYFEVKKNDELKNDKDDKLHSICWLFSGSGTKFYDSFRKSKLMVC